MLSRLQACLWVLLVFLVWAWAWQAQAQTGLSSQLQLGVGATQRIVEVPSADGPRRLDIGPAPAVSLGIVSDVQHGAYRLGLDLHYRTSMRGRVHDIAAGPNADTSITAVRSHLFEAGLRVGRVFGQDGRGVGLRLVAGYSIRAFASVAVLRVPRYALHGPFARLELELPLPAANLRLRIAPELQWLPSISSALRDISGISSSALALGGVVALVLPISQSFTLQLEYRESHAWAQAPAARSFSDVERYLLLGVAYAFL